MNKDHKMTRESLTSFFNQVNASDSLSGGIIRAVRPNVSVEWNEDEDIRRNHRNAESFVKQADKAAKLLATRK